MLYTILATIFPLLIMLSQQKPLCNDEFEERLEILVTNLTKTQLKIIVNRNPTFTNYVTIYNTIRQLIESVSIVNNEELNVNTTSYSNGMYYVALNEINVKPLKFIKVN